MTAQQWAKINYKHVPAECMKKNKSHFFRHDEQRLTKYLADVAMGKSKISGATLLPHELLIEALKASPNSSHPGGKMTPEKAVQLEIQRRLEEVCNLISLFKRKLNVYFSRIRKSSKLNGTRLLRDYVNLAL